jgi:hypothetical protein
MSSRKVLQTIALFGCGVAFCSVADAQFGYVQQNGGYGHNAYGYGADVHADQRGMTYRQGNAQTVERWDGGPSTVYQRQGDWEYRGQTNGVEGYHYYDRQNGVTRFDYRDYRTGQRTIGVNPYPNNPYVRPWSYTEYGW